MVRIIPNRLRSFRNGDSANNSGTSTPRTTNQREVSPGAAKMNTNGLMLNVVVMRGRNLAPKDKSGTSDPFLVLTLGDSRDTTQYVPKTLNPEWNHMCEFSVSSAKDLLIDVVCWDKDRFSKDYMGEIELPLEDIFANEKTAQPAKWYPLSSKRNSKKKNHKDGVVSGEVQLQFSLYDSSTQGSSPEQIMNKFWAIAGIEPDSVTSTAEGSSDTSPTGEDEDDDDELESPGDEISDPTQPEAIEKKRRKRRIRGLKKRKAHQLYEFVGQSDVVGIVYLEISSVTDLPPEKNMTRTSFDMDPFVIASLGKKTYRTRVIRHKLNPVFNEKMVFQVLRQEQAYSIAFTVVDRDKLSGNDFICAASIPVQDILKTAPRADPSTGLYDLPELPEAGPIQKQSKHSRFKVALSRSTSSQSLNKQARPALTTKASASGSTKSESVPKVTVDGKLAAEPISPPDAVETMEGAEDVVVEDLRQFDIPLKLKRAEKWEDKHKPELHIKAKFVPYPAIRQQFWRSMLRQYDVDESGSISKIELTTMLDTLGSTLKESTIDSFFQRFPHMLNDDEGVLTFDEAVLCLEDQLALRSKQAQTAADKLREKLAAGLASSAASSNTSLPMIHADDSETTLNTQDVDTVEDQHVPELGAAGEEGELLAADELNDKEEEHVIQIKECPICHQPRLNRRSDTDIITHIATCASQDWRQVNNIVMGGFVTSSQAQRKWYSKVISKISYGGYKLGANSANILVQDRLTGQINEERMSIYVRLGIRLLYKGLKSRDMEKKRIRKLLKGLSIKQGVKYDDPASKNEIPKFIAFHQLDLTEVKYPLDHFKTFNEFFYRELKEGARPVSAPENPRIIVSPADCRSVVFNQMDAAQKIWVKGREFSVKRLLGDAYPEDVERYTSGSLGIFRLAPQDYHRFHIPVDGTMGEPKTIEGEYYTVNPMAIRSALDVYGENVRVCVPIDSVAHGRVMVICVGAMMVGSTVITQQTGANVKRGDELGYFKFGGSTLLLLFEPGAMQYDDDLVDNSNSALETLIRVGMSIGHHPETGQHTPDMRKPDHEVSLEEREEAKRRIEGSLAPDRITGGAADLLPGNPGGMAANIS